MASKTPKNIAIILDGNRRFEKKIGLRPWKGHEYGIKRLHNLIDWCLKLGIKELTLYSFSTENFKRTKKEKDFLFGLFKREFRRMKEEEGALNKDVRINVIGNVGMFPDDIKNAMLEVVEKTKSHKGLVVNFALGYGGRQEITDAVKKIAKDVQKGRIMPERINEGLIAQNLYLKNEPDLIIRPGGEIRTSNFLTWQSAYSEWFFTKKLWPEFTKEDLIGCIKEFNNRERRFGK